MNLSSKQIVWAQHLIRLGWISFSSTLWTTWECSPRNIASSVPSTNYGKHNGDWRSTAHRFGSFHKKQSPQERKGRWERALTDVSVFLRDWLTGWLAEGNRPMRWPLNAWRNELNGEWLTTQGPTEWASFLFSKLPLLLAQSSLNRISPEATLFWAAPSMVSYSLLSYLISEPTLLWNNFRLKQ